MNGLLKENLKKIEEAISREWSADLSSRRPQIIAVSKKQPVEKIEELSKLGLSNFGENYLQEALSKMASLKSESIVWHYIGNIQSKKIRDLVEHFDWIHTVSRESELEKIDRCAGEKSKTQKILIQINIAGEENKQGVSVDSAESLVSKVSNYKNIDLRGVMVFPPLSQNGEDRLGWFEKSYTLFLKLQSQAGPHFDQLSMGTSQDYPLAVRKGATFVRIGESLMGPRP